MRKPSDYEWRREYHAIYIGRKERIRYAHSHQEIVAHYGRYVVDVLRLPHVFSRAMGDYAYIARSRTLADLEEMAKYAQQRAPSQA
jgi:hypothetical protein